MPRPESRPMFCYDCKELAVSRCRHCEQYYCARHGRGLCLDCAGAVGAGGDEPPVVALRCGVCGEPPEGICWHCRRPYCDRHGGERLVYAGENGDEKLARAPTCDGCAPSQIFAKLDLHYGIAAGLFILGALAAGALAVLYHVSNP